MTASSQEVTQLLQAWRGGDHAALEQLTPLVYDELRRLAHGYLRRENPGHSMQTSALVNEAFVHLIDQPKIQWQNRSHFFGVAASMMRHILLDHARSYARAKRGGGARHVELDKAALVSAERASELIALDDALHALAIYDGRKSRIVELRFFGGLSNAEIAEVMELSLTTVEREWRKAKAWLQRSISNNETAESDL